ncbi:MAG: hypothetical protein HQL30_10570 [Candidatus Omnitrophica bacterium]|nr:hypothetical protein [Candidatus Omnitrophota bacterium]
MKIMSLTLIAFLALGTYSSFASFSNNYEVAIVRVDGDVLMDEKGDGNWVPVERDMRLRADTKIKTGFYSEAEMVFDTDGLNFARVEQNTDTTIQKAGFGLKEGAIMANFFNMAAGENFIITTPVHAYAMTGSGMRVEYREGRGNYKLFEGKGFHQNVAPDGSLTGDPSGITEGNKLGVGADGIVGPTESVTPEEQSTWDKFIADLVNNGDDIRNRLKNLQDTVEGAENDNASQNLTKDQERILSNNS